MTEGIRKGKATIAESWEEHWMTSEIGPFFKVKKCSTTRISSDSHKSIH